MAGDPCHVGTGNNYQREIDYSGTGLLPLKLERHYNSDPQTPVANIGIGWRHNYDRKIVFTPESEAHVYRPDGVILKYQLDANDNATPIHTDISEKLEKINATTWNFTTQSAYVETYDSAGKLQTVTYKDHTHTLSYNDDGNPNTLDKVTDTYGRTLVLNYDVNFQITSVVDPASEVYLYGYDANGNLTTATYPDETPGDSTDNPVLTYHYEDPRFLNGLTGITDENGSRFTTWAYDYAGRVVSNEHSGGVDYTEFQYLPDASATVTDAVGHTVTYHFQAINGVLRPTQLDNGPCSNCAFQFQNFIYDANGFVASRTDFNGNVTNYVRDARGFETSRTEAVTTPDERTITTDWHTDFRLPIKITEPGKETTFTYDSAGRLLTRTETDTATLATRIATNSYNALGLIDTIDGPRTDVSDVTSFGYDIQGNLTSTTNALGQVTNISAHDAHGRPLTIADPNGTVTTLTYDARGRLLTRTVDSQTTTFEYDGAGNIIKTILPNGVFLLNEYDAAQRLTAVQDNLGNRIEYTLDALGNRTQENVKDPTAVLKRTLSRTYNNLNRLIETLGGAGQQTTYQYDANGNRTDTTVDPTGLNQVTQQAFNALNRLTSTTDATSGISQYSYDARNNLVSVTDPTGLVTTYTYDGLDNLTQQVSPDTAATSYIFDAAGNRLSQTDARGITASYTYDVLNRLQTITYPDPSQNVSFIYDNCQNGIGRLCQMVDQSGTTTYGYNPRGNLAARTTTLDGHIQTTGYAYNGANQLTQISYPSGRTVDYQRNTLGQVSAVTTNYDGQTDTLANNITYAPFGPLTGLTFGNGLVMTRSLDQDYRLVAQITGAVQALVYGLDNANNISQITNNLDNTRNQAYSYDPLNRLTDATGLYGSLSYSYDLNGNRITENRNSQIKTYSYPLDSHRLETITNGTTENFTYDLNGNTTDNSSYGFIYGDNNRLKAAQSSGVDIATYIYNGRGERVKKSGTDTTYYHYDQAGQLIAESGTNGEALKEYIYLDGMPIALIDISNVDSAAQIIDNDSCGTVVNGDWSVTTTVAGFEGSDYRQSPAGTGENSYHWVCTNITAGTYRLYAKWTAAPDRASNALYTIEQSGGSATIVNQQQDGGQFNLLGTYTIDQNSRISLSDQADGVVVADAVKLVPTTITVVINYFHNDHLGTPQVITDNTQTVVWATDYDPFGKATITTELITNNLRFRGQYYDQETGLHYNYYRYYDPNLDRYITSDPIGLQGGFNTYLYANANPIRYIDPLGLESEEFLKCVYDYLRANYGDWVADVLVPYFSAYSYIPGSPNFSEAATSTAVSTGAKAAVVGGAVYGGQAIQTAGMAIIPHSVSTGVSVFSAGATVEAVGVAGVWGIGVVGAAGLSFGTTAEFLARKACEEDDEC